ncbi:MAG: DUF1772 domain-containing protein [Saprospiraceae bacterium]
MEMNIKSITLLLAIITTALSAGLFYAWVVSVIPGTKKIPDQAYLETMQSINRAILNPGFFIIFFGAIVLLCASTFLQYRIKIDSVFYLMLSATIIYLVGTLGVTIFGNVPLNNIVEALDLSTFTEEDYKNARQVYEGKWNQLNLIRTIAALISFFLILIVGLKS